MAPKANELLKDPFPGRVPAVRLRSIRRLGSLNPGAHQVVVAAAQLDHGVGIFFQQISLLNQPLCGLTDQLLVV